MSQASSDSAEIITEFRAQLVDVFVIYSMTALVAYEYIITVNREVKVIWRRKWTLVTLVFVLNRYLMIADAIIQALPSTKKGCLPVLILDDIVAVVQYIVFAVFSALRVFAIGDRNIPIALFVLTLNLVPAAVVTFDFSHETAVFIADPVLGTYCASNSNVPSNIDFDLMLVTCLAVIASDVVVVALTWRKTFRNWMTGSRNDMQTPLSSLLIRDGTVYFIAILAMNVAQVLVNTVPSMQDASPVGNIIPILEPILISRFMLNLRQLGEPDNETEDTSNSKPSALLFSGPRFRAPTTMASIIGNMGEDLHYGPEELDADNLFEEANVGGSSEEAIMDAAPGITYFP